MIIFICRRIVLWLVTLGFLLILGFSIAYFPEQAALNKAAIFDAWRFWFHGLLHLNFGLSTVNDQPISEQLATAFPATIELCVIAFSLALILGIPAGIIAAFSQHKWQDHLISSFALLGLSIPVFWLALLLTLLFSLTLGWYPVSGRVDLLYSIPAVTGFNIIDVLLMHSPQQSELLKSIGQHLVLPVITLALAPMTEVIRLTRNSTLNVIDKGYIKAAIIRGLPRFTVIRRHLLHNAIPPIIPHLGLQFSTMLTLTMITEAVFNWPGIGRWVIIAIRQQDYASVSASVVLIGMLVVTINVVADIVGAALNPLKHKEWYGGR